MPATEQVSFPVQEVPLDLSIFLPSLEELLHGEEPVDISNLCSAALSQEEYIMPQLLDYTPAECCHFPENS